MPKPSITSDVLQAGNTLGHLPPQLPLNDVVLVEQRRHSGQLIFMKIASLCFGAYPRLQAELSCDSRADPIEVLKRVDGFFIRGNINAEKSWHGEAIPIGYPVLRDSSTGQRVRS